MNFHIVTPSFNQSAWLRLCLASVRDQVEADPDLHVHHHVQDGGSTDETAAVLAAHQAASGDYNNRYTFSFTQEPDDGMYDAINRGWRLADESVDVVAHLNCDEQYLRGALARVAQFLNARPTVDIALGDVIVIAPDGTCRCVRQVLRPTRYHTQLHYLDTFTASLFMRRRVLAADDAWFDPAWRVAGDMAWMLARLQAGTRMAVARDYWATFVDTGENLALSEAGQAERARLRQRAPAWARALRPVWLAGQRVRRLCHGLYWPKAVQYAIYTADSPAERERFRAERPSARWGGR